MNPDARWHGLWSRGSEQCHQPRTERRAKFGLWVCLIGLLAFLSGCFSRQPPTPSGLSDVERQLNLDSFDQVRRTVRDKHYDPTLGGLDWQAIGDEFRPAVEQANSVEEARRVMNRMLSRLGESHFAVLAGSSSSSGQTQNYLPDHPGEIGLEVRMVQQRPTVTYVSAGSSAQRAGIRTGWIVLHINHQPLQPRLQALADVYDSPIAAKFHQALLIRRMLDGSVGRRLTVGFLDETDTFIERTLMVEEPLGRITRLGHLPPVPVHVRIEQLPGQIGYIHLNRFFDPPTVMPLLENAFGQLADQPGLVLDLRGNTGGLGLMAMGIGGFLVDKPGLKLGTMITRDSRLNFVLHPRTPHYSGPVAVLVDELSASTSEILAQGLQDLGIARVFGTPTIGAALPSIVEQLPNGDRFQYALADYISVSGRRLEGRGVLPDVIIEPDRASLLNGRDPVIESALDWLHRQRQ